MLIILLDSLLISAGTYVAEKVPWIRAKWYRTGIFFGLMGILANSARCPMGDTGILIGLRDVPAIIASFFFSPAAGLLAGGLAALERILTPLFSSGAFPWVSAPATIVVTLYAASMAKWVFEGQRPPPIPAAVAALFGEILHLLLMILIEFAKGKTAPLLEVLHAAYPAVPLGAALAAGLSAIACRCWYGWRRNFFTSLVFGMLFFGVSFSVLVAALEENAARQTRHAILTGMDKLRVQFDDQIGYMLHCNAVSLRSQIEEKEDQKLTMAVMRDYAADYDVDEINLFSEDARLLATNLPEVQHHNGKQHPLGELKEFLDLTKGTRKFVKQDFRPSRSNPANITKYIGVPLTKRKGFLQLGYTWKRLEKEFSTFFFPMFNKTFIETDGCFIVTDHTGKIVAPVAGHPDAEGRMITAAGMTEAQRNIPPETFFETRLFGCYGQCCRSANLEQWEVYAFLPYTEFYDSAVILIGISGLVIFFICIAFRLTLIRIARDRAKIDSMRAADLGLASTIQTSELPEKHFENGTCAVHAEMNPAKEVGGDFYDYYELPDGRFAVTIADVSGKGVPAAIFMMKAKNMLRASVLGKTDLVGSVETTNRKLDQNNNAAMFVTAWVGIFDAGSGEMEYVSAGHNPPLILRKDGSAEWVKTSLRHRPLGAFRKTVYRRETLHLAPGDRLFLYTDGVTEAMNPEKELYGNDRLEETLEHCSGDPVKDVTLSLEEFIAAAPIADDITMLTLEVKE